MLIQVEEKPGEIEFVVTERPIRGLKRLLDTEDVDVQILQIKETRPCPRITITRQDAVNTPAHWAVMDNIRERVIAAGCSVANDWRRV